MSEVIVITSGKGGVGKTTTAANLGTALSLENKKTVIVDADIGLRNLDVVMGLENRIVYDIVDVVEGTCRLKQALIKDKRFENLYLLPAAQTRDKNAVTVEQMNDLCNKLRESFDYIIIDCPAGIEQGFKNAILPAAQTRDKNAVTVEQMNDLCNKLRESFDYIIIDCPAGIEQGFKNAIAGADRAIVVTNPEVSAVRDADRIIGLLEANEINDIRLVINRIRHDMVRRGDMMNKETNPEVSAVRDADRIIGLLEANEINDIRLVINRIRHDMVRRGDMMNKEDIIEILAIKLLGLVPDDESIIVSTNKGEPAILDNKSLAGQAYKNIARRILGDDVPMLELEEEANIFTKIKKIFGMAK